MGEFDAGSVVGIPDRPIIRMNLLIYILLALVLVVVFSYAAWGPAEDNIWVDGYACAKFDGFNMTEDTYACRLVGCVPVENGFGVNLEKCVCERTGTGVFRYCSEKYKTLEFKRGKELGEEVLGVQG